jgi:anti-repressor protein
MSSREIAEITGKRHDHVIRDCDNLNESYDKLSLPKVGESNFKAENGHTYREYLLTKIQTFDLMTGYNNLLYLQPPHQKGKQYLS